MFYLWILFYLIIPLQVRLFAVNREFTRLTIENGLSQSTVFDIIQDKKGYLWVTTQDGLNRYDGYTFKVFRHSITDSQSISDNSLSRLIQDKNGDIWISGANGNINRYHYENGKFSLYNLIKSDETLENAYINSMVLDSAGYIWFGMKGAISRLNPLTQNTTVYHRYSSNNEMKSPFVFIDKKIRFGPAIKKGCIFLTKPKKNLNWLVISLY